jgi:hypothetical protein
VNRQRPVVLQRGEGDRLTGQISITGSSFGKTTTGDGFVILVGFPAEAAPTTASAASAAPAAAA